MRSLFYDLLLSAQAAYAELQAQAIGRDLASLTALSGSFQSRVLKGRQYVYFSFRDAMGKNQMAYVGPQSPRVDRVVSSFDKQAALQSQESIVRLANACFALGCTPMLDKHYLAIQKLTAAGFFRSGCVLIGTHAFEAFSNMLGIRWNSDSQPDDVDLARARTSLSVAIPAGLHLPMHQAVASLEMGILPIRELCRKSAKRSLDSKEAELRIDLVTPKVGDETGRSERFGVTPKAFEFLDFLLEQTTRGVVMSRLGACAVNLPDPARYAIYKLIVYGERPANERLSASKGIGQASALIEWHLATGQAYRVQEAWDDAIQRGAIWKKKVLRGRSELLRRHRKLRVAFGAV